MSNDNCPVLLCCRKADEGLQKVSQSEETSGVTLANNKHLMAYGKICSLQCIAFKMQHLIATREQQLIKCGNEWVHVKCVGITYTHSAYILHVVIPVNLQCQTDIKECVPVLIELYKNNVTVSCVRSNFLSGLALYTANPQPLLIWFA